MEERDYANEETSSTRKVPLHPEPPVWLLDYARGRPGHQALVNALTSNNNLLNFTNIFFKTYLRIRSDKENPRGSLMTLHLTAMYRNFAMRVDSGDEKFGVYENETRGAAITPIWKGLQRALTGFRPGARHPNYVRGWPGITIKVNLATPVLIVNINNVFNNFVSHPDTYRTVEEEPRGRVTDKDRTEDFEVDARDEENGEPETKTGGVLFKPSGKGLPRALTGCRPRARHPKCVRGGPSITTNVSLASSVIDTIVNNNKLINNSVSCPDLNGTTMVDLGEGSEDSEDAVEIEIEIKKDEEADSNINPTMKDLMRARQRPRSGARPLRYDRGGPSAPTNVSLTTSDILSLSFSLKLVNNNINTILSFRGSGSSPTGIPRPETTEEDMRRSKSERGQEASSARTTFRDLAQRASTLLAGPRGMSAWWCGAGHSTGSAPPAAARRLRIAPRSAQLHTGKTITITTELNVKERNSVPPMPKTNPRNKMLNKGLKKEKKVTVRTRSVTVRINLGTASVGDSAIDAQPSLSDPKPNIQPDFKKTAEDRELQGSNILEEFATFVTYENRYVTEPSKDIKGLSMVARNEIKRMEKKIEEFMAEPVVAETIGDDQKKITVEKSANMPAPKRRSKRLRSAAESPLHLSTSDPSTSETTATEPTNKPRPPRPATARKLRPPRPTTARTTAPRKLRRVLGSVKLPINLAAEDPEQEMNQTNKIHRGLKEDEDKIHRGLKEDEAKKQIETDKENEDDDVDQDE